MKALELTDDRLAHADLPATFRDVAATSSTDAGLAPAIANPARPLNSFGRRCLREIREAAVVTFGHPVRLAYYGLAVWRSRSLGRAYSDALLVLGQRMYAAGIDDGEIGAKISAVAEQLRRAGVSRVSAEALRAEREKLFRQLAACALEDDAPLPGADAEYAESREAQAALKSHDAGVSALRSSLRDRVGWVRVATTLGAFGCLLLLALVLLLG